MPRAVHFNTPNPLIPWEKLPFKVPTQNTPLESDDPGATLFAGVSSFGFGGTNVHVVLESIPKAFDDDDFEAVEDEQSKNNLPVLLPISARSEAALRRAAKAYADLMDSKGVSGRYDRVVKVCMDAGINRTHHHGFRMAATGCSSAELRESIMSQLSDGMASFQPLSLQPAAPEVGFLFTGEGAEGYYANMGRQLYEKNAIFRAMMDDCDSIFQPLLDGRSILKEVVLASSDNASDVVGSTLAQATLFAVEYSMARVWIMFGIEPQVVMGYSVGEVVAAVVAGCMSVDSGAKIVAARAKALEALADGASGVLTVHAVKETVLGLLSSVSGNPALEIAAVNGETTVDVAGPVAGLESLEALLTEKQVRHSRSPAPCGYHSAATEAALPDVRAVGGGLEIKTPRIRFVSTVTGTELTGAPGPEYWADNVRKPVLFLDALHTVTQGAKPRVLVEVGPDAVLTAWARRTLGTDATKVH